jgi:hypothetical protein
LIGFNISKSDIETLEIVALETKQRPTIQQANPADGIKRACSPKIGLLLPTYLA